jgi:hypothetical protein
MTIQHTKLLTNVVVIIGAVLVASTLTSDAEANTKTSQIKTIGDFLSAYGSDGFSTYASVNTYITSTGDVVVYYGSNVGFGVCIADKSVLTGSGTSMLSLNVDTSLFTLVSPATNPGECESYSTLGPVSATVRGDGQYSGDFRGVNQSCSTSGTIQYCYSTNGHQHYESGSVLAGSVLGVDIPSQTYVSGSLGKTNAIFRTWTVP